MFPQKHLYLIVKVIQRMIKVVLDTDFLLKSLEYKINIFKELSRILDFQFTVNILDKTLDELKGKKFEKLALTFIKSKNISIIKTKKDKKVDDLLFEIPNITVATQDKELKEKLKKGKISVITIRQKRYLQNVL